MIPSDDLEKYLVDLNDHGGPAFPVLVPENVEGFMSLGMSLRDYFAAKAISTMIHMCEDRDGGWDPVAVAVGCYAVADAMLKVRGEDRSHEWK